MSPPQKNSDKAGVPKVIKGYTYRQFRTWQKYLGLTNKDIAERLGVNLQTVSSYRQRGTSLKIKLACRAVAMDLGKVQHTATYPWEKEIS